MQYYSTCPAGMEALAADMAAGHLPGFSLMRPLGGAVMYQAQENPARLRALRCFANSYEVLRTYPGGEDLPRTAARLARDSRLFGQIDARLRAHRFGSVRFMFSDQNALRSMDAQLRARLEGQIRACRIDRLSPDAELLLLRRSENMTLLLLRLTKRPASRKTTPKGQLMPEVASALVHLTQPRKDDVFADPFCGHGALGVERARARHSRILLSDSDPEMVREARRGIQGQPGASAFVMDALRPSPEWLSGGITAIATDPPWGLYQPLPMPAPAFYGQMLAAFDAALAKGGRIALLTAYKEGFEAAVESQGGFLILRRYDVLISGKKAGVYALSRRSR